MPKDVALHDIGDLSLTDSKNEVILRTNEDTELYIVVVSNKTLIKLPFGNKFDIVDNVIIIKT